jgi:hypothetical protein
MADSIFGGAARKARGDGAVVRCSATLPAGLELRLVLITGALHFRMVIAGIRLGYRQLTADICA